MGTHRSAIGQFFPLSPGTVPKVFAKLNRSGFFLVSIVTNSPVSISSRPLKRSTEDAFIQGQSRPEVKYSHIQARRCLNLSLKQQAQSYTGLLLTGICEYIYLESKLPCTSERLVLLFSGRNEFETGLLKRGCFLVLRNHC